MAKIGDGQVLTPQDHTDGTQVHEEVSSLPTPSNRPTGQVVLHNGIAKRNTGSSWIPFDKGNPPVGAIIAWDKSRTNTPALPANYAECNGQTLNDAESPYDGQTLPDLNNATSSGSNRFLRGNTTSGGTGGADTVTLAVSEIPSHNHDSHSHSTTDYNEAGRNGRVLDDSTGNTGGDGAHENKPPYYNVVMVMRIK